MKVTAIIERGNDGSYGVFIEDNKLSYSIIGDGKTVEEAKADFYTSYDEMKEYYIKEGKKFTECEFSFKMDVASFLQYYNKKFSLAGLEKITGINQGQLSHYVTGKRSPSKTTVQKIEQNLHEFAKELNQIEFV